MLILCPFTLCQIPMGRRGKSRKRQQRNKFANQNQNTTKPKRTYKVVALDVDSEVKEILDMDTVFWSMTDD